MATPRVAAGALFVDAAGRVLTVRPSYKDFWDIPGGYVEPGESPRSACLREVREELGLTPTVGTPLVVDWAPADGEGDKLLFVFDGGTLTDEQLSQIKLNPTELDEWRFVDPAELDNLMPGRLSRRIRTALTARSEQRSVYAEHGTEVAG